MENGCYQFSLVGHRYGECAAVFEIYFDSFTLVEHQELKLAQSVPRTSDALLQIRKARQRPRPQMRT